MSRCIHPSRVFVIFPGHGGGTGHHEISEVLFFLDIFGKVTSKIVGLYSETKLDKVVHKHEQIGIEGQEVARGHNSDDNMSCLASVPAFLDQMVTSQPLLA
jgi:hypothetical protein